MGHVSTPIEVFFNAELEAHTKTLRGLFCSKNPREMPLYLIKNVKNTKPEIECLNKKKSTKFQ